MPQFSESPTLPKLTILAPLGYPWTFSGPRQSRHDIRRRAFVPFNRLRSSLDGFTVFNPVDSLRSDLIHAFNRIPFGTTPFVIGFESHLPRLFGVRSKWLRHLMWRELLSRRCRRIVALSDFARRTFEGQIAEISFGAEAQASLLAKLERRYPSIDLAPDCDAQKSLSGEIHLTFVGNHFARKGGCVVLRMAELSLARRLPFHFHIVSRLKCGGAIWSDPTDPATFEPYLRLLTLPNVSYTSGLPNTEVTALLRRSHLTLLPTFSDTFGFSAVESMAMGTPVVATCLAALPEFIVDGESGLLLPPPATEGDETWQPDYDKRSTNAIKRLFQYHVERLAHEGLERIEGLLADAAAYARMRETAQASCRAHFEPIEASRYWDGLYEASAP